MLAYDAAVLVVDMIKSWCLGTQGEGQLRAYWKWIILNIAFAVICWLAALEPKFLAPFAPEWLSCYVFAIALARTILDYVFGGRFMFP
jgi:hypothetical protein